MRVCMKTSALHSFIHSLGIIQDILTVSAQPMTIAGQAVFQDRRGEYKISSL